jgi:hypothetical protein
MAGTPSTSKHAPNNMRAASFPPITPAEAYFFLGYVSISINFELPVKVPSFQYFVP